MIAGSLVGVMLLMAAIQFAVMSLVFWVTVNYVLKEEADFRRCLSAVLVIACFAVLARGAGALFPVVGVPAAYVLTFLVMITATEQYIGFDRKHAIWLAVVFMAIMIPVQFALGRTREAVGTSVAEAVKETRAQELDAYQREVLAVLGNALDANYQLFPSLEAAEAVSELRPAISSGTRDLPRGASLNIHRDKLSRDIYVYLPARHRLHRFWISDPFRDGMEMKLRTGGSAIKEMPPADAAKRIWEILPKADELVRELRPPVKPGETSPPAPAPPAGPAEGAALAELYIGLAGRKWEEKDYAHSIAAARAAKSIYSKSLGPADPKIAEVNKMIEAAIEQLNARAAKRRADYEAQNPD